jgi:hypothetical protein
VAGYSFERGDVLRLGLCVGAAITMFAGYSIIGTILTLVSKDSVESVYDRLGQIARSARRGGSARSWGSAHSGVVEVTRGIPRSDTRESRQDTPEDASR